MFIRKKSNNIIKNMKPHNIVPKYDKKAVTENNESQTENIVKEEHLEEVSKPVRSKTKKTVEEKE